MSTAQLLEHLRQLSDVERLEVIEVATRLIRDNLAASTTDAAMDEDRRLRAAAAAAKDLYEPGGELTEWTALGAEEFVDEHFAR
jgi:predicted nuclease with RNAse H fold